MVALLGSGDELLRVIENSFDADIHVRGNEITIYRQRRPRRRSWPSCSRSSPPCWPAGAELTAGAVERIIPCSAANRACARPRC